MKGPKHRPARSEDAFGLMKLHQQADARPREPLLLDLAALQSDLSRPDRAWLLSEEGGEPTAFLCLGLESGLRLGKVQQMCAAGTAAERRGRHRALLAYALEELARRTELEVVYSTTRTLTLEEQASTLDCGFKVLGVFPNAVSADTHRLNGLTAWYAPGVLKRKRHGGFSLHPLAEPFYELARGQCGLPALPQAQRPDPPAGAAPLPELELLHAPRFVAERFRQLRERRSLSVNFYPFQEPDSVFTSPDQSVEVFASVSPERRFASLIGERLTAAVDPVALYRRVSSMLHDRQVQYIEIINDAADILGIECILRAGFSPCGYFPCLKHTGQARRDYLIFARSFEFFHYRPLPIDGAYTGFLLEFCKARSTLPTAASQQTSEAALPDSSRVPQEASDALAGPTRA